MTATTTVKPKRHSPNALTRIIYLPGVCTKTIMYTLRLGRIRTGGRVPPLIRWHLVNFVNERRHVLLCRPPRTTSKASRLPSHSMLCCYQAERADLRILDLSQYQRQGISKRAKADTEDDSTCPPYLYGIVHLIKCIFENFSCAVHDIANNNRD